MSGEPLVKLSKTSDHIEFEEIDHTADRALRIHGSDMQALFINAVRGMNSILVADISVIPMQVEKQIALEAIDAESLLVEWLSEFAYLAESEMLVFDKFDLKTTSRSRIQATVCGGKTPNLE